MNSNFFNVEFKELSPSGKTSIYDVLAKGGHISLGCIKWYGPWRKYCFFPNPDTLFDHKCLNDLALQCEEFTKIKKQTHKHEK